MRTTRTVSPIRVVQRRGQPAEELVRRLGRAVLDHQASDLRDDATLLLAQWTGAPDQPGR